jgi:23S rRNA (cytosine1962-C5)-methyltransferase
LAEPLTVDGHGYELIDVGDGRRLERFGDLIVDRPAPRAEGPRLDAAAWSTADLQFDRDARWLPAAATMPAAWPITVEGLELEHRPAAGGQVGLFPEQLELVPWLRQQVAGGASSVLNLFAYTGLATLVLARAGAAIAHVDASKPAVAWARRNAELSGLTDRPIRWLVDDALGFVRREARRRRRYDGVILDPPTYGHAGGTTWKLESDLGPLLDASGELLEPGGFVLLTSHTPEFWAGALSDALENAFGGRRSIESGELTIEARSGARLELGAYARFGR